MLEFVTEEETAEVRVPVFSIDGVAYTMPEHVPVNVAYKAMNMFRKEGPVATTFWLMEEMLGQDGLDAMLAYRSLNNERWNQVGKVLSEHVMGSLESEPGKRGSRNAGRKSAGSSTTKRISKRTSAGSTT